MGATAAMEKKNITVSQKRQITLPIKFYKKLNIGDEVECYMEGNKIILEPVRKESSYFAQEILAELIAEGYEKEDLLKEFAKRESQMRGAVRNMIEEAESLSAAGKLSSYEDVFGE